MPPGFIADKGSYFISRAHIRPWDNLAFDQLLQPGTDVTRQLNSVHNGLKVITRCIAAFVEVLEFDDRLLARIHVAQ